MLHRFTFWVRIHLAWLFYWLGDKIVPPFEQWPGYEPVPEAKYYYPPIENPQVTADGGYITVYNEAGDVAYTNSPYEWVTGSPADDAEDWR